MDIQVKNGVYEFAENLSSPLNYKGSEIAIILAAGHGKRIKSHLSKMLHTIWDVPTVERVYNACHDGIKDVSLIVVVGIKAIDVMGVLGKRDFTAYAYQEFQNGTGHALQIALKKINEKNFDGNIYVLPGDMGLINQETMSRFRKDFISSRSDMMVLTGIYEGIPSENHYGRIIRVKENNEQGKSSGKDKGRVIEILEYKDILALPADQLYKVNFNGNVYSFSQKELIDNNEFNSGVYAFNYKILISLVNQISSNNAQGEIYITDLISLFNQNNYSVMAVSPAEQHVVMGFNNKSVLKEMETVARLNNYNRLKDIIEIDDPDDFFIHESVIDQIIEFDKLNVPLDITIGKGVYIGKGVQLNYNNEFKQNSFLDGDIRLGKNVVIWKDVQISTFPGQTMKIGDDVQILWGNTIKGNIEIGKGTRIESSVRLTGSNDFPLHIGSGVLIKGTTYIYGSLIEDNIYIENCVIIKKKVEKHVGKNGDVKPVRFYIPPPEGIDAITDL
ncbi:MAG: NTP transferase domain-containing protein [Ignavibacteriaceae bacterium]|nr:NTP transferase domain-containing protein [Ignavibacteriaceae bacterium]